MESVSLYLEKLFSWFSQRVLKFYFISSVPVNGIFSKRIRVKLDSEESPALVLRESSHLDAAFSDLVFKILPKQNISTNQQWTICRPKLRCEVLKTKAYLTSETSIPTSEGKPFMNTLSRTSKKFPPIKGIIYNIIGKLAWRSTLLNERRLHNLKHAGNSGFCHLYFTDRFSHVPNSDGFARPPKTKFLILFPQYYFSLSHKESEIGGFPP